MDGQTDRKVRQRHATQSAQYLAPPNVEAILSQYLNTYSVTSERNCNMHFFLKTLSQQAQTTCVWQPLAVRPLQKPKRSATTLHTWLNTMKLHD